MATQEESQDMAHPPLQMGLKIAGMLSDADPDFSDLIVQYGTHEWRVHKLVLCTQSNFFCNVCKNGLWGGGRDGVVDLSQCHSARGVDAMLQYFYTSDYSTDVDTRDEPRDCPSLLLHIDVYLAAWKISCSELGDIAIGNFCEEVESYWFTPTFAHAIDELYSCVLGSVQPMRDAAIQVAARHAKELLKEDFGEEFRQVVKEREYFARAFRTAAIEALEDMGLYFCVEQAKLFNAPDSEFAACTWCRRAQFEVGHHKVENDIETERLLNELRNANI
ncbi:hypothetical protein PRZ48_006558 [Zasmidium cellare]|uniref:BTB domain-containing protein n=1 Tax=Zasmidium cellare TaxID=395010 RepID=A0ABR0ENF3_ZASCE|nr:hypothetical protein PRZ48_006558 [Zasmidium cellare]